MEDVVKSKVVRTLKKIISKTNAAPSTYLAIEFYFIHFYLLFALLNLDLKKILVVFKEDRISESKTLTFPE